MTNRVAPPAAIDSWRKVLLLAGIFLALTGMSTRAFYVQVLDRDRYFQRGKMQQVRVVQMPAHRGMLLDRNGVPLAISAPVSAVCVNPKKFDPKPDQLKALAQLLDMPGGALRKKVERFRGRSFLYLKRQMPPVLAKQIEALAIEGVFIKDELRRYYPAAEVTAHLLGFTNIDQRGQEGLERMFETRLQGISGAKRVLQDRKARVIEDIELLRAPRPGKDIRLSLDMRLQYWAYRALKEAVAKHHAKGGSVVMLDARNGEILALANQPAYNPNSRESLRPGLFRNRSVVDIFEPGSTVKPLAMACALKAKVIGPNTVFGTHPGYLRVGRHLVRDHRYEGPLTPAGILQKSSNVGITKIILRLTPEKFSTCLKDFGVGKATGVGFPGEARGVLPDFHGWGEFEQATMAFGYGLSVSAVQLARAYTAFSDNGVIHSVSVLPRRQDDRATRIMPGATARLVKSMLEGVVSPQGTARKAQVPGYRVAGKTGTARKAIPGGYAKDRYLALFVGMAPASDPRLVLAVTIDEPQGKQYYGGDVAAPVFADIMGAALRLLGVAPDQKPLADTLLVYQGRREVG